MAKTRENDEGPATEPTEPVATSWKVMQVSTMLSDMVPGGARNNGGGKIYSVMLQPVAGGNAVSGQLVVRMDRLPVVQPGDVVRWDVPL